MKKNHHPAYWSKFVRGPRPIMVIWPDVELPDWYSMTEYKNNINGFTGASIFLRVKGKEGEEDKFVPMTKDLLKKHIKNDKIATTVPRADSVEVKSEADVAVMGGEPMTV
jgi:hypothetical protein